MAQHGGNCRVQALEQSLMHYQMSEDKHRRIFGDPDPMDATPPGRSRRCKETGQWIPAGQRGHNNPERRPPRNPSLAAPSLAPKFEPFMTGRLDTASYIGSRNDKRDFRERNNLVEYDEGVDHRNHWVEAHDDARELMQTVKMFEEIDSENLAPELKAQDMDDKAALDGSDEVKIDSDMEVIE